jgi:hypothetical protein
LPLPLRLPSGSRGRSSTSVRATSFARLMTLFHSISPILGRKQFLNGASFTFGKIHGSESIPQATPSWFGKLNLCRPLNRLAELWVIAECPLKVTTKHAKLAEEGPKTSRSLRLNSVYADPKCMSLNVKRIKEKASATPKL